MLPLVQADSFVIVAVVDLQVVVVVVFEWLPVAATAKGLLRGLWRPLATIWPAAAALRPARRQQLPDGAASRPSLLAVPNG